MQSNVHFFALDSYGMMLMAETGEDGQAEGDEYPTMECQKAWLQKRLYKARDAKMWKVVYFYHSPYSTALRGGEESADGLDTTVPFPEAADGQTPNAQGGAEFMRWPFHEWGVDVVISGYNRIYERLQPPQGVLYMVVGSGGEELDELAAPPFGGETGRHFEAAAAASTFRYNGDFGALVVTAKDRYEGGMQLSFLNLAGETVDDVFLWSTSIIPEFKPGDSEELVDEDWGRPVREVLPECLGTANYSKECLRKSGPSVLDTHRTPDAQASRRAPSGGGSSRHLARMGAGGVLGGTAAAAISAAAILFKRRSMGGRGTLGLRQPRREAGEQCK